MSRSPKLGLYALLAAGSFTIALVLGRPELVGLGAPFALVLVLGLSAAPPSPPKAAIRLDRERALEGDEVAAEIVVSSSGAGQEVQIEPVFPSGLRLADDEPTFVVWLEAGEERTIPVGLVCEHWGVQPAGDLYLRAGDQARLRLCDGRSESTTFLRVYPRQERLQRLIDPLETQPFAGNRVSRAKAEGIEFADVRPYTPGDRIRRLNWRASSRRQALYVNQQHPERNSDVIIFLDSFSGARRAYESTLDMAVRAATALSSHYLAVQDRVGLVSFGGIVRWLTPAAGNIQTYRIAESLLATEINFSYVWRRIDALPARSLTPQALVIALSPLLDERGMHALLDLRRRGFELVIVDVSPLGFVPEPETAADAQAIRLWRLWRRALHFRYAQLGIAVVDWDGKEPLAETVEGVRALHRFARRTFA